MHHHKCEIIKNYIHICSSPDFTEICRELNMLKASCCRNTTLVGQSRHGAWCCPEMGRIPGQASGPSLLLLSPWHLEQIWTESTFTQMWEECKNYYGINPEHISYISIKWGGLGGQISFFDQWMRCKHFMLWILEITLCISYTPIWKFNTY